MMFGVWMWGCGGMQFDEDTDAADDIVTEALSELNIGLSGQMVQ